jgi:uncharacterized SAM-binding protein YcdF (DUF218 family)
MLRRLIALVLVLLALGLYAFRVPILTAAARFLIVDDPPVAADAIVVLSGSFPDRILEAVSLYKDGYAAKILLCREPENRALDRLRARGVQVERGYELDRSVAEQLGVPAAAIQVTDRSAGSTFTEALEVLGYCRRKGYRSILLVTSKIHTHRASLIYRFLSGGQIRIISRPAREDDFRPDAWWSNRVSTRRVLIEYEKLLVFYLVDRWRLQPLANGAPHAEPRP